MRLLYFIVILLTIFSCNQKQEENNLDANFDYSGIEGYFNLIDNLLLNKSLSNKQWTEFINIKGNKLYIEENNISDDFLNKIKENIRKAYTTEVINEEKDIFYKIRSLYKDNDSIFRKHLEFIKNNEQSIMDSMLARTIRFLPNNKLVNDSLPRFYYHGLDHDGSANSKGIFISIMAAYQNNTRRLSNFESHEFFHIQRPNTLENVKVDSVDNGIIWAINASLNEGLADMIDKDVMLSETSDWWLKEMVNDFYVGNSKQVIENFDELIRNEAIGQHHKQQEYRDVFLGSVGHVPGYWMAKLISDNGGANEMIENADNPFAFFILYNKIAKMNPGKYPVYDTVSINHIKELSKKYVK